MGIWPNGVAGTPRRACYIPRMVPSDVRSPVRVVGRYTFAHEIAAGGMATVHLGKMMGPLGFSPLVAIKILHPQFAKDPEFVRMFLDEARLAARIRHPNIVPVIDVHAEDGVLFLVLEYIHGEALGRVITASHRVGTLPSLGVTAAVMCDVLQGLHAAHEAKDERGEPLGIVHRDVSPQNVLVGTDGVARVLDFGIAKATGRLTTTRDGQVKGKFSYMAPEQLRGESVDRRADVYSSAVVLWEMLTTERLFRGDNEGQAVGRVLFGPIDPPSTRRPEISPALDAVVMRGLSRERADRFATAKEMAMALAAAVLPAPTPEVGEWVEARAIDALEQRAKLVEEIEVSVPSADAVSAVRAAAVPESAIRARVRATRLPLMMAAALLVVLSVGVAVGMYGTRSGSAASAAPQASSTASAPPSKPAPSAIAAPPVTASAADSASASPSVAQPSESRPSRAPPAPSPAARGPRPPIKVVSGAAKGACTRRNASGEYEFDTECLRGQRP
jgi:eukaryotic-like serine/threonine-protein kinase